MTLFFLIRHAAHDQVEGALVGRTPGVRLGARGHRELEWLAERLSDQNIDAIETSPLERARDTAVAVAQRLQLRVETVEALNEIDFGAWSGRTFEELSDQPLWRRWNAFRSGSRPPGGESMIEAQSRVVRRLEELRVDRPGGRIAVVSHCDVIRAALAYYLGQPLDLFLRLEIAPASISVLEIGDWGPTLRLMNETMPHGAA